MSASLGGTVLKHARNSGFATPKDETATLDKEAHTLIHLGVALATGSHACIDAMMDRARASGIDKSKILETYKIARFAEATRVMGNAESLLDKLTTL